MNEVVATDLDDPECTTFNTFEPSSYHIGMAKLYENKLVTCLLT